MSSTIRYLRTDNTTRKPGRPKAALVAVILLLGSLAEVATAQSAAALPELISLTPAELQTSPGAEIAAADSRFRERLGSDDEAALEAAKQVIALGVQLWQEQDLRVAAALTNLAIAQANTGNYEAARDNFLAAIRVIEVGSSSIIEPSLVNPLRGLASTLIALDNTELAIPVFERAIHVTHVNEGPNNLEQLPIMEALSRAFFFMGEVGDASDVQDNIFRLQQRRFDEDSDQYLDALLGRARWYTRIENFDEATEAYRRAERILTTSVGEDDIRLIAPLLDLGFVAPRQSLGNSSLNEQAIVKEGRRAVARAVRIARVHDDKFPGLLARTLARQGDWYMSIGASRSARLPYREAWELADSDPALHFLRDELFAEPYPVAQVELDGIFGYAADQLPMTERYHNDRGFVEVRFSVNMVGKPYDIQLIDSEPPGLMEPHVFRQIGRFIYRPAFRDGNPVVTEGLVYRHEFRYREDRLSDRNRAFIKRMREEREAQQEPQDSAADPQTSGDATEDS